MITTEDLQKLISGLKEFFYSKEDMDVKFGELKQGFNSLQTSVDAYAKKADLYYQEMAVMRHRMERMEEWIQKASQKIGVEYKV